MTLKNPKMAKVKTHLLLGFEGVLLPLGGLANAATSPEDRAHAGVRHPHDDDRHDVRDNQE